MPIPRTGAGPASGGFSPAALPGLVITLFPALSRSQGKLWQDAGKTVAATANGDPVRVATCPYTGLDLTAPSDAARPLLTDEGGGKWSLTFDGVNDTLTRAIFPGGATASFTTATRALWLAFGAGRTHLYGQVNEQVELYREAPSLTFRFRDFAGNYVGVSQADVSLSTWYATGHRNSGASAPNSVTARTIGRADVTTTGGVGGTNVSANVVGFAQNFAGTFGNVKVAGAAFYTTALSDPNWNALLTFLNTL